MTSLPRSDARAHRQLSKIMIKLIRDLIRKALEGDMDSVKSYCEAQAATDQAQGSAPG